MINISTFINNFKWNHNETELIDTFTNGNCYHFALILSTMFDGEIMYDPVDGHFFTMVGHRSYDITGEIDQPKTAYVWRLFKNKEPLQYQAIVSDCIYKIKR